MRCAPVSPEPAGDGLSVVYRPQRKPRYPLPIIRVTDTSMATRVVLSPGWP